LLDIVPNHMAIVTPHNRWWWDVLENGPSSRYAGYFDVDWDPPEAKLRNTVLLPVLEDQYGRVLEKGLLAVARTDGTFTVRYHDHEWPVAPHSIDALLAGAAERAGSDDLGDRRVFDVNTLVGLRVEVERVFFDTHHLVLGWLDDGTVDGLRIDHPDGLRDPAAYLHRLRSARPGVWVVVEKVLEPGESLPESWPVEGTTGYDFMWRASSLFVDPEGERPLTDLYAELTGEPVDYAEVLRVQKHRVLREVLGSDVNRLTALLLEVCERHRNYRDHTRHELHEVLRELIACFPVYRTYVSLEAESVS